MNDKVLVILETDPETGMSVANTHPHDKHRVACAVEPKTLERWARAKQIWEDAQGEMAAIFQANGGRFYGDPLAEPTADTEVKDGS